MIRLDLYAIQLVLSSIVLDFPCYLIYLYEGVMTVVSDEQISKKKKKKYIAVRKFGKADRFVKKA